MFSQACVWSRVGVVGMSEWVGMARRYPSGGGVCPGGIPEGKGLGIPGGGVPGGWASQRGEGVST